jgi:hypothetical protein
MKEMLNSNCKGLLLMLCSFFFLQSGIAQNELVCDGETHLVGYNGSYQDFVVPDDPTILQLEINAKGGDGGFADLGNDCKSDGGEGASVALVFDIGDEANQIPHGSTIRFIVGQAGEKGTSSDVLGTGFTYGGGGGGTGVLYQAPGSDEWLVLAVAGGGGGAYQGSIVGFCVDSEEGQGGRAGTAGGDGNGDIARGEGGADGNGGQASFEISAGGGGALTAGEGITCIEIIGTLEVGEGQAGLTEGGAGGQSEGCFSFTFRDGGFGFGGGGCGIGAGGGGGGYSGGGGGGSTGRGGGGGSYAVDWATDHSIEAGQSSAETLNGFVTYTCIKSNPPTALCVGSLSVPLDADGFVSIDVEQIDNGSFHDSEIEFTLSLSQDIFNCEDIGDNIVVLTATDVNGQSTECETTITIADGMAPTITCPANITVACDTSALDNTGLALAIDNCDASPTLSYSDNVIGNCDWACTVERNWVAIDQYGNESNCTQIIERSPIELISDALDGDEENGEAAAPLVLGFTHKTLMIHAEATDCMIDWLSDIPTGIASTLPNGNYEVDGSDCNPSFMDFDSEGRISNPLLAQAMLLNLHLRVDPDLADMPISTFDCDVHPVLLQALPGNATFGELATVTNYALANLIFTPFLDMLVGSLECFNSNLSFCKTSENPTLPLVESTGNRVVLENFQNTTKELTVFPNPARSQVFIQLPEATAEVLQIELYNLQGQQVRQIQSEVNDAPYAMDLNGLVSGVYQIKIWGNTQELITKKLIVQ